MMDDKITKNHPAEEMNKQETVPAKKSKTDSKNQAGTTAAPEDCYVNRELSWLEFNQRVLLEAADRSVPLLERLKFLMIYQSNMEEFYRVRVGILTHQEKLTPNRKDPVSGWTASEQISQIHLKTAQQHSLSTGVWKAIKEELKKDGVDLMDFRKISKVDELMCKKHFIAFRHMLLPQIIEPSKPLPFLWGEEDYVISFLGRGPEPRLVVVALDRLPAYTAFELDGRTKIVLTSRLVRQFMPNLMKKEEIRESVVVRVTRNADVFIEDNEDNDDFRDKMAKMLKKRQRELPVRVQIYGKLSAPNKTLLAKKLGVPEELIFTSNVPFNLSFRSAVPALTGYKYDERKPARNIGLNKGEYFKYLEHHDLLLSYPFQNMLPFVDMLYEAVDDPDVISIKITLYRLSLSSKVAAALAYAADRGKDVLCLLELRARFDEQSNIDYSEMLEDAGCRVIYGLPDMKVHSKLCLITRSSGGNICHITQVGTGNYNESTSEQYTDLSLITSDEGVAADAERTFHALEAGEIPPVAENLWIAPKSFKSRVLEMMDREIEKGKDGRICIKVNSLNNLDIMHKLIECSQAGVSVEMFIRGICCLKPGIPGMTENITIKSVVGRWLEHSRIFCFGTGDDERLFIGSGDLLNRNLERRVEAFIEVKTEETREQIHEILNAFHKDREKARVMQPDGSYLREPGGEGTSSQERLYHYFYNRKVNFSPDDVPEEDENIEAVAVEAEEAETVEETVEAEATEVAEAAEEITETAEAEATEVAETAEAAAETEVTEAAEAVETAAETVAETAEAEAIAIAETAEAEAETVEETVEAAVEAAEAEVTEATEAEETAAETVAETAEAEATEAAEAAEEAAEIVEETVEAAVEAAETEVTEAAEVAEEAAETVTETVEAEATEAVEAVETAAETVAETAEAEVSKAAESIESAAQPEGPAPEEKKEGSSILGFFRRLFGG